MWFLFQQPEEFLERFHAEREREERRERLVRDLRASAAATVSPEPRRREVALADPCGGNLAAERS